MNNLYKYNSFGQRVFDKTKLAERLNAVPSQHSNAPISSEAIMDDPYIRNQKGFFNSEHAKYRLEQKNQQLRDEIVNEELASKSYYQKLKEIANG